MSASEPIAAVLVLADGTRFEGQALGHSGNTAGEVVFNTAMTGYQEIMTDPSYAGQIVVLTHPHIGNTGSNAEDVESDRVHACGLVLRNLPQQASSHRNQQSWDAWLKQRGISAIAGIDTRALTLHLRTHGAQNGAIVHGPESGQGLRLAAQAPALEGLDLASVVSTTERYQWRQGLWPHYRTSSNTYRVVAYDFGIKHNILRHLAERGCTVDVVPATTSAAEVLALQPDGVFLSNGPGDPAACGYAIAATAELLAQRIPLFGICLGHQILALAAGAATTKMKFGHHGANHPVQDLSSSRVLITSQNHGFCVKEGSLKAGWVVTHRSLFDHTIQGIAHDTHPVFGFQGHPEASPGPQDMAGLFDRFIQHMVQRKR